MFKKKGLLKSQAGGTAGEGVAYLKSASLLSMAQGTLLTVCFSGCGGLECQVRSRVCRPYTSIYRVSSDDTGGAL